MRVVAFLIFALVLAPFLPCVHAQNYILQSPLDAGSVYSWDNFSTWAVSSPPDTPLLPIPSRVFLNATCTPGTCSNGPIYIQLPAREVSLSYLQIDGNIVLIGTTGSILEAGETDWLRGGVRAGDYRFTKTALGQLINGLNPTWTVGEGTTLTLIGTTTINDGVNLELLPGASDAGSVSVAMADVVMASGQAVASVRATPASAGSSLSIATLTIPNPSVPRVLNAATPSLSLEVGSLTVTGAVDLGRTTFLRINTTSTVFSFSTSALFTMSQEYARAQFISASGFSLEKLPKFAIDSTYGGPLSSPIVTFSSSVNRGSNSSVLLNTPASGSALFNMWWEVYGEMLFPADVITKINVTGIVMRGGSVLRALGAVGNDPNNWSQLTATNAFLVAPLANPSNISSVILNITGTLVDTHPALSSDSAPTGVILSHGALILSTTTTANFSRPTTFIRGYRCDPTMCGLINFGTLYFNQYQPVSSGAMATNVVNVPFDNEGTVQLIGSAGANKGSIVTFTGPNARAPSDVRGGSWVLLHAVDMSQSFASVQFNLNSNPVSGGVEYYFGPSTSLHGNVAASSMLFTNGIFNFDVAGPTILENSKWENAALLLDPSAELTLRNMQGINFGALQRSTAVPITATLVLNNAFIDFSSSYSAIPQYRLSSIVLLNLVVVNNWKMDVLNNALGLKVSMGASVSIDGSLFKSTPTSDTKLTIVVDTGGSLNVTDAASLSWVTTYNLGNLRLVVPSDMGIWTQSQSFTLNMPFQSEGTLAFSAVAPISHFDLTTYPPTGQYIVLKTQDSVINGTVSLEQNGTALAQGSYYIVRHRLGVPRQTGVAASVADGQGIALSTVSIPNDNSEWIVATVAPLPPSSQGGSVIGAAVGVPIALIALIAIALVLFFLLRKRNNNKTKEDNDEKKQLSEPDKKSGDIETGNNANYGPVDSVGQKKAKRSAKDEGAEAHYGAIATSGATLERTVSGIDKSKAALKDQNMEWQIPFEELAFQQELGSGAFGSVWKGKWNGTDCAIKQSLLVSASAAQAADFELEAKLMTKLRPHPNVCQILGISITKDRMLLVMEYCKRGSLTSYFGKGRLDGPRKLHLISGLAQGISHLHKNRIIHRDIAARNVLVTSDWTAKISDFGLSRLIGNEKSGTTASTIGPVRWMAPESIKSKQYSPASDAWSFGIAIWEIFTEKEPYSELDILDVALKVRDEKMTPVLPNSMPDSIKEICRSCWQLNPDDRPSFDQIVKDIAAIIGEEDEEESSSSQK